MNGFENIKERVELREKFREETGDNWENSQGEPDIDYVLWLESKLFAIPVVSNNEALDSSSEGVAVCICENAEKEKDSLFPVYCTNCNAYVQTDC